MSSLEIVIGNKAYSSWSLRGWLAVKLSGRPFAEVRIPMYTEQWEKRIGGLSPSGRVPVLRDGDTVVWDSLAIGEYMAESYPGSVGWPHERSARAAARSVVAEMHSGFAHMREEMPFNCRAQVRGLRFSPQAMEDVERTQTIWRDCRATYGAGGPWLFGAFSLADIAFVPVALRFLTYGIPLGPLESDYAEAVRNHPAVREWCEAARAEEEVIPDYERRP
jgi:glutathione S-transferase